MEVDADHFDIKVCAGGKYRQLTDSVEPTVQQETGKGGCDKSYHRIAGPAAAEHADGCEDGAEEYQSYITAHRSAHIDAALTRQPLKRKEIEKSGYQCNNDDNKAGQVFPRYQLSPAERNGLQDL